jgi:hypothetical protein
VKIYVEIVYDSSPGFENVTHFTEAHYGKILFVRRWCITHKDIGFSDFVHRPDIS